MSSTKAEVDPAMCSATATAASLADAIITAFAPVFRRWRRPPGRFGSGAERRERVGAQHELIGLGPDHAPVAVELAVEQEPADVTGTAQERDEPLPREPPRHVAARGDQV